MKHALAIIAALILIGCASTERVQYLEWRLKYAEDFQRDLSRYVHQVDQKDMTWMEVGFLLRGDVLSREIDSVCQVIKWGSRPRFLWSRPPLPRPGGCR